MSTLSKQQLALGNLAAAVVSGEQSVDYADQSGDMFWRMGTRTTHAAALHQTGKTLRAYELFIAAEQIQQEDQPKTPRLYSLQAFRYCDLLLAQDEVVKVLERAEESIRWEEQMHDAPVQDFALHQLTLGRAYYQQGDFPQATDWLDQAVTGLRATGEQEMLPLGLLARAALYRDTRNPKHDFTRAHQDLQEVYDIAEPSGMRLHLTDYHLEMARLLIAEQENPPQFPVEKGESAEDSPQKHITKAAKLIKETGYKRRLPELEELQNKVAM